MVYFYTISVIIVVFYGIGLFGNFNVIWATYRHKHLRNKHGLLLANLAVYHIICISNQFVNMKYSYSHQLPRQNECFKWILPYVFAICAQAMMYVVIGGDLLAAILVPLKHRIIRPLPYVLIVSVPVWLYSTTVTVWGAFSVEERTIMFCNPTLALSGTVNRFWLYSNLAIIAVVIIFHLMARMILVNRIAAHRRSSSMSKESERNGILRRSVYKDQQKALHSISIQLVLFLWAWCTAIVAIEFLDDILYKYLPNHEIRDILQSYMVFFALLCYSQSYYILFWRSPEYAAAFKEQLRIMRRSFVDEKGKGLKSREYTVTTEGVRRFSGTGSVKV
ncbi:unnamed protein product [Cylicocyclus nassatus]|uniref:G-protein coupled receptors family 1 profile domain-containing protein n=1 Tax=Cylicocyclus nassatus TaxID=53992 RepID=A0AA36H1E5_CYLNA|nr:unnamed protein product [Cylicocyclus nassatus]